MTAALARLGTRIRELRLARGLTQERAAGLADLDPKGFQSIERGKTNLTMASLVAIAKALDVNLQDLFDGVHERR